MARQHVPHARELETAIQLDVVHAGDAENGVDAVGGQRLDDVTADRPGSRAHALEMLTPHTHSKYVKFSPLVERISGDGADAWLTHYGRSRRASAARTSSSSASAIRIWHTPPQVVERAIAQLRAGDTHYLPAAGRAALREAIARTHSARSGQEVSAQSVVYFAGAQNALFVASLCLAGPGDEVLTFEPLYPTYPATLEVSGARLVRVPAGAGWRPDLAALARA